jgi:hypothetical protein
MLVAGTALVLALGTLPRDMHLAGAGPGCRGVSIAAEANIQKAIDRRPAGTRFCLHGTYHIGRTIVPKDGTRLRGPAVIRPRSSGILEAIDASKAVRVHLIRLEISGFKERAFECGARSLVRASYFHNNRRNGMGGGECHRMLVVGTELAFNGTDRQLGKGAGGIKVAGSVGVVIRENFVHDNIGTGIWCDENCRDWLVAGNRTVRNARKGIFFEKGDGAVIRYNVSRRNNRYLQDVGGGIGTVSSRDVKIYGNRLGSNKKHGIKVWKDSRGYALHGIVVRQNDLNGDDISGCKELGVTCTGNVDVGG